MTAIGTNDFKLTAVVNITEAYCKLPSCGEPLEEVSNGFFKRAMFCPKCERVYELELVKVKKNVLSKRYLAQCRREVAKRRKLRE